MTIWFATGNMHKKAELAAILNTALRGRDLRIPTDAGLDFDPEETGTSFHENALLKARELHALLAERGLLTPGDVIIADDSGLCVDALDGRPGIFSARYVGRQEGTGDWGLGTRDCCSQSKRLDNPLCLLTNLPSPQSPVPSPLLSPPHKKLTSAERNALLLEEMGDAPVRTARFVCAMAVMLGESRFLLAQETLEGEIVAGGEAAKGTGGFGYDPIFFLPELGRTVAELSETEKNTISHRAKAGKLMANMLEACW